MGWADECQVLPLPQLGSSTVSSPEQAASSASSSAPQYPDVRRIVLFDFGGVITTSPFEAFAAYEQRVGLPPSSVRRINSTNPDTNAWAQFERSEVSIDGFIEQFEAEGASLGLQVDGAEVLACLSGNVRPQMVAALDRLTSSGCRIGCITNNVSSGHGSAMATDRGRADEIASIMARFEVVIESSKVGVRKPDPRIYELACAEMGVDPTQAIYLDDLGINCKAAHGLGMVAIKVIDPDDALAELAAATGIEWA
jgi:putative hydrolase of the HAD superfamily